MQSGFAAVPGRAAEPAIFAVCGPASETTVRSFPLPQALTAANAQAASEHLIH